MDEESLYFQIYVVRADGKKRVRLTHGTQNNWLPAWSPDGRVIAYYVWDGILEGKLHGTIHLMTADGKYLRQLSNDRNAQDYQPDISPLGLAVSPAANKITVWGKLKILLD
jgi:Tol biopolymer transport system component